jgi:thiol-disulfide isomerase/thioredoxin
MAVTFGADGRFVVDDLPPGEFDAELEIYRPPVLVGSAHKKLAIATPDKIPATAPQDSGAWTVKSAITAKTGETAPDFEAPALAEGENIRLSQYRGKYVLIHFWATWASPRFAMLPGLKQCKAEYPQLVTIGLNLDSDAGLARHYANKTGMTGPQGWLGEWSQARLPGRYGASIPSACLISPEGKILALNIDFTALPDCLHGSKSR